VDRGAPRPCPGPNKNVEATQPDTISDVLDWKSGATVIWLESTANPQPRQKENTIEEVKNEQCTYAHCSRRSTGMNCMHFICFRMNIRNVTSRPDTNVRVISTHENNKVS
jgi:hypothetical protein